MKTKDYFKILREIKDVSFATVDEDGHPQVRIIDVMIIENKKLYFVTARGKDFYKQLEEKQEVAITGVNKKYQTVRLNGKVKKLEKGWVDRVFDENLSMNNVYPGKSRYILEAFCLYEGHGEFFDLSVSPIFRESFSFGNCEIEKKGFIISEECIGCNSCAKDCPQQCITKGSPYVINQLNCLHCGLCFERCPVKAIKRI
ncbi:ferredoxin [Clostridium puniceum]|uniref:Ferredoxin n=1 Tax=Clostridium puniceum TaxID=29367 RepID=A0A1S8TD95_9CLOT|nr:4Fe-4S binding protein [Clostridium puniceum]OOM75589.1 ferredoxin [Clostridium puniceum]